MSVKRLWSLLMVLVLSVCMLSSCGKTESDTAKEKKSDGKVNIVATEFAPYDFAKNVAGDSAHVSMLLAPGEEAHSFEPTPKDMIKIQQCDVFVYTGGESDSWVDEILDSLDSDITVVKLMDCVDLYQQERVEGMEADRDADSGDSGEVEYDEHVWTAPANAIKITEALGEAFEGADPAHKTDYEKNTASYVKQLKKLDNAFWDVVNHAKRKTLVFGDRFPLRYFVEEYGLKYYAAFPGCASDTEPNAKTVAFLIDKVKEDNIPVVLHVELSNQNMVKTICAETGAKNRQFNACHNITKEQFKKGYGYLDMMWENVSVLKEALN